MDQNSGWGNPHSEVIAQYIRGRSRERCAKDQPVSVDLVGRATVARLDVRGLARSELWAESPALRDAALDVLEKEPAFRDDPGDLPRAHHDARLDELESEMRTRGMLLHVPNADVLAQTRRVAFAGLFPVPKGEKVPPPATQKARLVWDDRPGNALLAPPRWFPMFELEMLILCMLSFPFVLAWDHRHFYWQLPIHAALRLLFLVKLHGRVYAPAAAPQGWNGACRYAQAVSWMFVLFREAGESPLGARDTPKDIPPVVWLHGDNGTVAGAIMVLLDNIIIFTRTFGLHAAWLRRMRRNAKKWKMDVKEVHVLRADNPAKLPDDAGCACRASAGVYEKEGACASCAGPAVEQLMSPDGIPYIAFGGVATGGRLSDRTVWAHQVRKSPVDVDAARTRRDASVLVGTCIWVLRCRQSPLLNHEPLLQLSSRVGTAGSEAEWDSPLYLTEEEGRELRSVLRSGSVPISTIEWHPGLAYLVRKPETRQLYEVKFGKVSYETRILAADARPDLQAAVGLSADYVVRYVHTTRVQYRIVDESELAAVALAVQIERGAVKPAAGAVEPPACDLLLIVAEDNRVAEWGIRGWRSRSATARRGLRALKTVCEPDSGGRRVWIVAERVGTKEIVADVPTRPEGGALVVVGPLEAQSCPDVAYRLRETVAKLIAPYSRTLSGLEVLKSPASVLLG